MSENVRIRYHDNYGQNGVPGCNDYTVFSYNTALVQRCGEVFYGNLTHYSRQSDDHALIAGTERCDILVYGVPRGTQSLVEYAEQYPNMALPNVIRDAQGSLNYRWALGSNYTTHAEEMKGITARIQHERRFS